MRSLVVLVALVLSACSAAGPSGGSSVAATTSPSHVGDPRPISAGSSGTESTTSAEPSSTRSSTSVPPLREPIVLGFAGDTSFTDGLAERDPLGQVATLLQEPDLMVVNLETAVADPAIGAPPVSKPFLFRSPPGSIDLLVAAGIDVVTLANNHTLDFGPDALRQTLVELDTRGFPRVGAGVDETAAYRPLVVDVGPWSVGLVSLSRVPCDWSASGQNVRPEVAWACDPFLALADAAVAEAMAQSDLTVVLVHEGEEGVLCPSPFMTELNRHWAALGVDIVVNGHPHVVQGIRSVGDTLIVNSTGNFAFPPARSVSANSGIFRFTVSDTPSGRPSLGWSLVPLRADGGMVTVPSTEQAEAIIDQVNAVSDGWQLDDRGQAHADPGFSGTCR
ncbi:MAG: CapA family protein [Actinomycetota bacterium]|nr:CapA family protein [Actinomycetota bacterium]